MEMFNLLKIYPERSVFLRREVLKVKLYTKAGSIVRSVLSGGWDPVQREPPIRRICTGPQTHKTCAIVIAKKSTLISAIN